MIRYWLISKPVNICETFKVRELDDHRIILSGKNVLTEKPTGATYDEIKLCYETAEKNDKILVTGFQRYHIL